MRTPGISVAMQNECLSTTETYLKVVLELMESEVPLSRVHIAERSQQSGPTVTNTVVLLKTCARTCTSRPCRTRADMLRA